MSFRPVYLKGIKRTPYLGGYLPSAKEQAEWELLLYRSLLREGFQNQPPSLMLHSYPSEQRGAQIDFSKELMENTPPLFLRLDACPFYGVEALWAASKELENYPSFFLLGGGQGPENSHFLSERISREEQYLRTDLDLWAFEQMKQYEKMSSQGAFSSQILPVFQSKQFQRLLSHDLLFHRSWNLEDLKSFPALLDRVRGVVTKGNSANSVSAFAALGLSQSSEGAWLAIEQINFFFFEQGTSWRNFVKDVFSNWEKKFSLKLKNYSQVGFIEVSSAQSALMQKICEEDFLLSKEQINPFAGNLGRGVCPPIEAWVSLAQFEFLYSEQKALLVVTHSEGHLALIEVRKI